MSSSPAEKEEEGIVWAPLWYLRPELRDASPKVGTTKERLAATREEMMPIRDARAAKNAGEVFSLDTSGFVLLNHESQCTDFRDTNQVRRVFFPEMIGLVKQLTGAEHAVVTGPATVRTDEDWSFYQEDGGEDGGVPYALWPHLDFNDGVSRKAPRRFRRMANLSVEKGGLGGSPIPEDQAVADYDYVDYNIWRPIDREVEQFPLALLHTGTLDPVRDLASCQGLHSPPGGATICIQHPSHRWYYVPRMRPDEIFIFMGQKTPHQEGNGRPGSGRNCPHVAFLDPTAPKGALQRRSVEVRVCAAFPREKKGELAAKL